MRVQLFTHLFAIVLATKTFNLEVFYNAAVHSPPHYLSCGDSPLTIDESPSNFFLKENHLCNKFQECVRIAPNGGLALSTNPQEADAFQLDYVGELEVVTFDGNKNRKFYVCQEEGGQTIRSFGDLDNIGINCEMVRIFVSAEYDRPTPSTRTLITIDTFQLPGSANENTDGLQVDLPDLPQTLFQRNNENLSQMIKTPKRLLILDSNGRYASALCAQGLARGYEINVMVESSKVISSDLRPHVTIFEGDVLSIDTVSLALVNVDVVVSMLTFIGGGKGQPVADFYENLILAMKQQGVQRIIVASGAHRNDQEDAGTGKIQWLSKLLLSTLLKSLLNQIDRVNEIITTSGLQFTVLKMHIPHGSATRKPTPYRLEYKTNSQGLLHVSRGNIIHFIFRELTTNEWIFETPIIHNI